MRFGQLLVVGSCVALLSGCAKGTTSGAALVHPVFPYAVTYDDQAQKSVLGEDWILESYRKQTKAGATASVELLRKDGNDSKYFLDFNDDGQSDLTVTLPFPDLVFVHRKTNATLEVSTILLDERLADKELRVLLNDIVASKSGTRALFVGIGKVAAGVEKRFASRLVDAHEGYLDGRKGLVATIERADLDQLQLNPNARWQRTRLFMMHAPFDYQASTSQTSAHHKYGVLLLAEYTNTPEDFDAQYPEFVRLLSKTHVLTDSMLLEYFGDLLAQCAKAGSSATLQILVNASGQPWVRSAQGISSTCTKSVHSYRFAATGQPRELTANYDFSKPQRPAWLTQAAYVEERAASAAAAAPSNGTDGTAPAPTSGVPGAPAAPATSAVVSAPAAPGAPSTPSVAPAGPQSPVEPSLNRAPAATP